MANNIFAASLSGIIYILVLASLYLYNNYAGFLMNIIFGGMIVSIFIISVISEIIQNSKISKVYFWSLGGLILACAICGILFQYEF